MNIIYTLHHSVNREETFPTLEALRRFVRNPINEHLLAGAKADKREIYNDEAGEPEKVDLNKLTQ